MFQWAKFLKSFSTPSPLPTLHKRERTTKGSHHWPQTTDYFALVSELLWLFSFMAGNLGFLPLCLPFYTRTSGSPTASTCFTTNLKTESPFAVIFSSCARANTSFLRVFFAEVMSRSGRRSWCSWSCLSSFSCLAQSLEINPEFWRPPTWNQHWRDWESTEYRPRSSPHPEYRGTFFPPSDWRYLFGS